MKNSIEINKTIWNETYDWKDNGEEWNGQAIKCGLPYEEWKKSVIQRLIVPNVGNESTILEIGPGHGRWSRYLAKYAASLILVDLSPKCIEFCRSLFTQRHNLRYLVNDGRSLAGVEDASVDFIWSFDTFVHMEKQVIGSYLGEIFRVLKPDGRAVIHHPGRNHLLLWLGFTRHYGRFGNRIYRYLSMGWTRDSDGWRSNVSKKNINDLAAYHALKIIDQFQFWDEKSKTGVPRFNDYITILSPDLPVVKKHP